MSFSKAMKAMEEAKQTLDLSPTQAKAIAVLGTWTNRASDRGRSVWLSPRDAAFGYVKLSASTIRVLVRKRLIGQQDESRRVCLTNYGWDVYYDIMDSLIQFQWDGSQNYQDEGDVAVNAVSVATVGEDGYEDIAFERLRDLPADEAKEAPPVQKKRRRRRRKQKEKRPQRYNEDVEIPDDATEQELLYKKVVDAANRTEPEIPQPVIDGMKVRMLLNQFTAAIRSGQQDYTGNLPNFSKAVAELAEKLNIATTTTTATANRPKRGRPKKRKKSMFETATKDAWEELPDDDSLLVKGKMADVVGWDEDPPRNVPVKRRKNRSRLEKDFANLIDEGPAKNKRRAKRSPRSAQTRKAAAKASVSAQKGWETRRKNKAKRQEAKRRELEDAEFGLVGDLIDPEFE